MFDFDVVTGPGPLKPSEPDKQREQDKPAGAGEQRQPAHPARAEAPARS
jgi:hypothetical protein